MPAFRQRVGHRRTDLSLRIGDATQGVSGLARGNFSRRPRHSAWLGRTFTDSEASQTRPSLVVARPRILATAFQIGFECDRADVDLNGRHYTLIGVLAPHYRIGDTVEQPDL